MRIIGITGGICSGKSGVTKMVLRRGFPVIDCDKITDYKFIIVGNSLFQVGALTDYTESGFMGLFPGERRDYFTFVSALDESEDVYKNLEYYLAATFEHINSFINTSDLVEKWVDECPEDAKKAINKLSELLGMK